MEVSLAQRCDDLTSICFEQMENSLSTGLIIIFITSFDK